jgi:excisionase family DNA binding protein|tara:strand:- start:461 stop:658 length:198 start_codon:yes stop_codon:yes gene_type:complete
MSNITNYQGHESIGIQREKEAASRLAISTRTLDRLVAQGLIGKIFVGSSVRFKEREVAAVVEHGI